MSVLELLKMPVEMKAACVEVAIMDSKMQEADAKFEQMLANLKATNSANPR